VRSYDDLRLRPPSGPARRRYAYDYDFAFRRTLQDPEPSLGWIPGTWIAGAPMFGWGWWGAPWGTPPYGVPASHLRRARGPRRPDPRESPYYGRAADRAIRQWARRRGYDTDIVLRPRRPR
jgi:hypothetical protein